VTSAAIAVVLAVTTIARQPARVPDPHDGAYTRGLGVECAHCHDGSDWTRSGRPTFATAQRMARLVAGLNAGSLMTRGGITCFTCHGGSTTPSRMPRSAWQPIFDEWPATATVSAADAAKPAREVYRNLRVLGGIDARNVRLTMSVIAGALGVNCEYCHAGDEWDSDNKPAKQTARQMLRMFDELPTYFEPGTSPAFQCFTCHKGSTAVAR